MLSEPESKKNYRFIDVRPPLAYEYAKISDDFENIPMPIFAGKIDSMLEDEKDVVITCRAGNDSRRALLKLQ